MFSSKYVSKFLRKRVFKKKSFIKKTNNLLIVCKYLCINSFSDTIGLFGENTLDKVNLFKIFFQKNVRKGKLFTICSSKKFNKSSVSRNKIKRNLRVISNLYIKTSKYIDKLFDIQYIPITYIGYTTKKKLDFVQIKQEIFSTLDFMHRKQIYFNKSQKNI